MKTDPQFFLPRQRWWHWLPTVLLAMLTAGCGLIFPDKPSAFLVEFSPDALFREVLPERTVELRRGEFSRMRSSDRIRHSYSHSFILPEAERPGVLLELEGALRAEVQGKGGEITASSWSGDDFSIEYRIEAGDRKGAIDVFSLRGSGSLFSVVIMISETSD
jgi:hypothetical protein